MSIEELRFEEIDSGEDVIIKFKDNSLWIDGWEFDRGEAHLLMLYLQEHLGAVQQKEI